MKKIGLLILIIGVLLLNSIFNNRKVKIKEIAIEKEILDINKNFLLLKDKDQTKLLDLEKNIELKSEMIKRLSRNLYFFQNNEKSYVINIKNNKKVNLDSIVKLGNDRYLVSDNKKFGILDEELKVKIPITKDGIISNNGKGFLATRGEEYYFIDEKFEKNKILGMFKIVSLSGINHLIFESGGKFGIIDKNNKIKVQAKYIRFLEINNKDILIGYTDTESYFINLSLGIEKKVNYDNYGEEYFGKIMILKDKKLGYLNSYGDEISPIVYDGAFPFKEEKNFLQLKKDGSWFIKNIKNNKLEKLNYDDMGELVSNYMIVLKDEKYGYLDKNLTEKIPTKYIYAENFDKNRAVVATETGYGLIDKNGKEITPMIYDDIKILDNRAFIRKNNKMGIINRNGKVIVPIEYDELGLGDGKYIYYKKNNSRGVIEINEK